MAQHSILVSWRSFLFKGGVWTVLLLALGGGLSPAAPLGESDFKAATISKIISYVTWPRSDSPLVVGLYGSDPFGGRLQRLLHGQAIRGRPVQVRVVQNSQQLAECQVLFVPSSNTAEWARACRGMPLQGQLTVGDHPKFATGLGGICRISFPERGLEINRNNARAADLKISSRLLKIATLVGQ